MIIVQFVFTYIFIEAEREEQDFSSLTGYICVLRNGVGVALATREIAWIFKYVNL